MKHKKEGKHKIHKYRLGDRERIHKLDGEVVMLNQAQHGTLSRTNMLHMVLGTAGVTAKTLAERAVKRAKRARK
jgi:hypothetical protein